MAEEDLREVVEYSRFVTYRIAQLSTKLNKQASRVLKEHGGLSLVQWRILALVHLSGPVYSATLVKSIHMDAGLFSRNLKSMIELKLIKATADKDDSRKQLLTLTSRGKKQYAKAGPAMEVRRQNLTRGMNAEDKESLFRLLDILDRNASEQFEVPGMGN